MIASFSVQRSASTTDHVRKVSLTAHQILLGKPLPEGNVLESQDGAPLFNEPRRRSRRESWKPTRWPLTGHR